MREYEGIYLHKWKNIEDMKGRFWPYPGMKGYEQLTNQLDGVTILLAAYSEYSYEGMAFVLFEKGGKLYEVNAFHCSCYGLENQWRPEETTVEHLRFRLKQGRLGKVYGDANFDEELDEVLNHLARGL